MRVSYSRVDFFKRCPYQYNLRYLRHLKVLEDDAPDNALNLGTALHKGLETDVETAIHEYYMTYPCINNKHINEAIKLETMIPRAKAMIPEGEHEVKIKDDDFIGYIDLLVPAKSDTKLNGEYQTIPNLFDIYDFKYSNNVSTYKQSAQLHLYKYFFEKTHPGMKIRNLYFLFVPKTGIRQKESEDLYQFRQRIKEELKNKNPKLVQIDYDPGKVIEFLLDTKQMLETIDFPKKEGWLCRYCNYKEYCQEGKKYMILPKCERRNISQIKRRKMWIYGAAFSGKTTMLDKAPAPLNLNTDGNIEFVTMPYIAIKDQVTKTGRMTERKFAWDVFKETIEELEKGDNDFKTIIIDLLEDTREMCRIKMYDDLNIQHESDAGFGKGWDIIKTEYLSTMRRFFNLDYENLIVVSHEDVSKDITKKNGQNITRIAPNIQDAIANKIAGMVDIVARVVVEDDGSRTLNFKQNEVIFGGGRLKGIKETTIPLDWDALMDVYDHANSTAEAAEATEKPKRKAKKKVEETPVETEEPVKTEDTEPTTEEVEEVEEEVTEPEEPEKVEEPKPRKRVRRKRA